MGYELSEAEPRDCSSLHHWDGVVLCMEVIHEYLPKQVGRERRRKAQGKEEEWEGHAQAHSEGHLAL